MFLWPRLRLNQQFSRNLGIGGHDTWAIQDWLGHRSIQHAVRYTELAPTRFRDFWREAEPASRNGVKGLEPDDLPLSRDRARARLHQPICAARKYPRLRRERPSAGRSPRSLRLCR
jgi:hypothetical protein